jgi:hypothetical protein
MFGYDYPQPPLDASMPQTLQWVLTIVFSAVTIGWVLFALRECTTKRTWVPLFIVLGGAIAILYEPMGDALEMAYYPPNGQATWMELFDRRVPVFIGVSFFSYFGTVTWVFLALQRKGFTAARWWGFFFALVVMRIAQDELILSFGSSWIYYGPQPFQFRYFPLWVAFPTAVFQIVVGTGIHAIVTTLPAKRHWLIVPAVPLLFLAGHAGAVFPATIALYNKSSSAWLYGGTIASVALSCLIVWTLGQWMIVRNAGRAG